MEMRAVAATAANRQHYYILYISFGVLSSQLVIQKGRERERETVHWIMVKRATTMSPLCMLYYDTYWSIRFSFLVSFFCLPVYIVPLSLNQHQTIDNNSKNNNNGLCVLEASLRLCRFYKYVSLPTDAKPGNLNCNFTFSFCENCTRFRCILLHWYQHIKSIGACFPLYPSSSIKSICLCEMLK